MAEAKEQLKPHPEPNGPPPATIEAAFQLAQNFAPARPQDLMLSASTVQEYAKEEAVFGRIDVDEHGLTAGMRLHLLQPARQQLGGWLAARAAFDQFLAPHLDKIRELDKFEEEIAELKRKGKREEDERERTHEANTKYAQAKERYENAEARFKQKFAENNQRVANTRGNHPSYFLALAFTGVAEWFINYDVFVRFLQVPAWAAATAIILGALLAFAAHGHGTLLKQWSHRFSLTRSRAQRFTDWRLLSLSTFGLMIVLSAAGGSRYAAVMRLIGSVPAVNLLGAEADIDINPVRDVLISLLGNLGAWAVGVFLAYLLHDSDPDYMEAATELEKARKRYNKLRKALDKDVETIRARNAEEVKKKENAAQSVRRGFERLRDMLLQVDAHGDRIVETLEAGLLGNAQSYHDALVQIAAKDPAKLSFHRAPDGNAMSAYEYKTMTIGVSGSVVRGLT